MDTSEAFREFCYRWTCKCGHDNRSKEMSAGSKPKCDECGEQSVIKVVFYDNGAFVQATS